MQAVSGEQAVSGGPVRYFDERDLASLGRLPAGYLLSSDLPSVSFPGNDQGWVVGDTRIYTGPAGIGTLTIAQLVVTKGIIPLTPWPWPGKVRVHGRVAALRVDQADGVVFSRNITWVEHGYRFVVNSHGQEPLSTAQTRRGGERDTASAWLTPVDTIRPSKRSEAGRQVL